MMKVYDNLRSYKLYLVVLQAVIAVKPYFIAPNTRDFHWEKMKLRASTEKLQQLPVNCVPGIENNCPLRIPRTIWDKPSVANVPNICVIIKCRVAALSVRISRVHRCPYFDRFKYLQRFYFFILFFCFL